MKPTGLKRIQSKLWPWIGSLSRAVEELLGQECLWNQLSQGSQIILNGPIISERTCLECQDKEMLKTTLLTIRIKENSSQRFPTISKQAISIQWLGAQTETRPLKTNTCPIGQGNGLHQARLIITISPNQASARATCKQMDRIWYSISTYSRTRLLRNDRLHPSLSIMKRRRSLSDSKRNQRRGRRIMIWLVLKSRGKLKILIAHLLPAVRTWFPRTRVNSRVLNSVMQGTKSLGMKRSVEWLHLSKFFSTQIEKSLQLPQALTLVLKQFKSSPWWRNNLKH